MIKSIFKYGALCLVLMQLWSCSSEEKDAVAQVSDKILYHSDIAEILPKDISHEDSILLANDYVKKWIKQELLIQKADENLSEEQKDVRKELEAYRKSLIIYKYKHELIKQRLDTVVHREEIEKYYEEHPSDFNLNRCIVKAVFIKIPLDLAQPEQVKTLLEDSSDEGIAELRAYCGRYAKKVDVSIENWIDFKVLADNLPLEINNPQQFLRETEMKEMNDSNYYYIVHIHDYKLINDLAPIEFVEHNIKNLILNQRKIIFLKELEEIIYNEGIKQNKFKIYNKKTNETSMIPSTRGQISE